MADRTRTSLPRQNLFTIPGTMPFLSTLAERLVDGTLVPGFDPLGDPLALADVTIFVPTRRAARGLKEAFRIAMGGNAVLLPDIHPLGGPDETEILLRGEPDLDPLPPAISSLERRMAMTRLILGWAGQLRRDVLHLAPEEPLAVPASPADAAWLAADLLSLMDQMETEEASWDQILSLVPDDFANYWQITLDFLKIATQAWPQWLAERKAMDPNQRRTALIRREADRFANSAPKGPVIVAGSTGSIPATADLIKTVATMAKGAVVLPGLDLQMDSEVWRKLAVDGDAASSHPQYGFRLLLAHLGVERSDVVDLSHNVSPRLDDREKIVATALMPADQTDLWQEFLKSPVADRRSSAFESVSLIEAHTEAEEGLALALVLREAVEKGLTASLVTPDRTLARRVAGEMRRWGMEVDDSAGRPLDQTPPAILARLVAEAALEGLDPVTLLALLKHPLTRLGLPAGEIRDAARALERAVLRGPKPRPGCEGLLAAIAAAKIEIARDSHVPRWQQVTEDEWEALQDLASRLSAALGPLERIAQHSEKIDVPEIVRIHVAALKEIATDEAGSDFELFKGEAGEMLAKALTGMMEAVDVGLSIHGRDWPGVFAAFIAGAGVQNRIPTDPRVHILGPLEARLQRSDIVVLASLNEGIWPQTTRNDPWLNRPMKREIGLEPPERRIGLAAHDFAQGMGAEGVVLSRSERSGGAPTVASRWLQRVQTVVGGDANEAMKRRGLCYLEWARGIDRSDEAIKLAQRPNPKPPVAARPQQISITSVETWIRDPYAIFAKRILGLEPVDPLGMEPGVSDKGTLIHDILAEFLEVWKGPFDTSARDALVDIGKKRFESLQAFPDVYALWWPRFLRISAWFVEFERERDPRVRNRHLEISGAVNLPRTADDFRLTGRADRIDEMDDGSLAALDYKTGQAPSLKQVEALLSPQLPLEAAMISLGGFEGVDPKAPVAELAYVVLRGGTIPGEFQRRQPKKLTVPELAGEAISRLAALVAAYDHVDQGYLSRARPKLEGVMDGDYDHLARVQEWSVGEEEDD